MIDGNLRRRSLEFIAQNGSIDFNPREEVDTADNQNILNEIKVRHYAGFARLIDMMIDEVEAARLLTVGEGFPLSPYRERGDSGPQKLRLDALKVFIDAALKLEDSSEYKEVDCLSELRAEISDRGYIPPAGQLAAGADTAISSMLTILNNLPSVINYHKPSLVPVDLRTVAQNSVGLPWGISMISINQLMAAQATLSGQLIQKGWAHIDAKLDPTYFKVIASGDELGQSNLIASIKW